MAEHTPQNPGTVDDQPPTAADGLTVHAPAHSPNDEAIAVAVSGLAAGEPVTVTAELVAHDGVTWRSEATFTADGDGTVSLADHAPESGSYGGVEPMGWYWSMAADDEETRFPAVSDEPTIDVELRATAGDRSASRTITRQVYDESVTARPVDHDDVVGTLYEPPGEGPHPAVVELHGSAGRLSDSTAKALANEGYATLAIDYFGEGGPIPDDHRNVPLSYFDTAVDWLRDQLGVHEGPVGLVGASRGAELALLLGARRDWVGAVVSYAGSAVMWDTPSGEPAWTDDGEPVPHVVADPVPGASVEQGLTDEQLERATVHVEETDGPVLLLSGGDDEVWQARYLSALAMDRLEAAEFPHRFEHHTYDGAGHYIGRPYVPMAGVGPADRAKATAHAAADSWPRVKAFLADGLGTTETGET
ncbi:acyl-CoA thioesterase/bile acid-CoA:amino acid N-acyltransferase family protein [Haloarchaeobius iranensis]|uniref:Acyl-CoA thioester hydrolase/BAAT N-terminal region n=1 Tax=Haloarchaeobius iranensis TaxID=996166 RepID=A0A1G9UNU6_9EURY|nr:acyl-CoA thioesterase/bile acid-CoA:amino acid N-acyltransferase family protein [Haloarchaeobius iranensis]SDM61590.1 Acyl-CoA thioester hydrolase/BAAT N-terminal region [Haloarchaeobius iranensis]